MRLEFDGAPFCGWQLQPQDKNGGRPSVQELVEQAIATLVMGDASLRIPIQGCGRTDAGVHAEEFYCHVDLSAEQFERARDFERFRHGLNAVLPEAIAVTECCEAAQAFHAIDSIASKTYEYRVFLRRSKPTLQRGRYHWLPVAPDSPHLKWDDLDQALEILQGTHDFAAFRAAHASAKTTVRTLYRCEYRTESFGQDPAQGVFVTIELEGSGFLRHMVRNLSGTLLEILQGRRSVENLCALLGVDTGKPADRIEAGYCAPPEGLYLKRVKYRKEG